jgi:phosphoribosylformylglycinamidine synthase
MVPGVFTVNENPKFNCEWVDLKVKTNRTPFTKNYNKDQIIQMPVAHAEGRYFNKEIETLESQDQIVLQFEGKNPNGSLKAITGVCDESGLVCAVMPHPERASEKILGSDDGLNFFKGMLK